MLSRVAQNVAQKLQAQEHDAHALDRVMKNTLMNGHPPDQQPLPGPRIVGGIPVDAMKFPFYTRLDLGGSLCGGSLIDHKFVLTAAHCVHGSHGTIEANGYAHFGHDDDSGSGWNWNHDESIRITKVAAPNTRNRRRALTRTPCLHSLYHGTGARDPKLQHQHAGKRGG